MPAVKSLGRELTMKRFLPLCQVSSGSDCSNATWSRQASHSLDLYLALSFLRTPRFLPEFKALGGETTVNTFYMEALHPVLFLLLFAHL